MFGLRTKKTNVLYGVIYDIGSESVGVSIVRSDKAVPYPETIFYHRVHMRITKASLTNAERIRSMREALFSASLIISREGLQALAKKDELARVGEIMLTVSAPWAHTIARSVRYSAEKELKVTRALIDDLITSAEAEIHTHLKEAFEDTSLAYEIVERATVDVSINDYPVAHPLGLHGKELSLVHVTGVIPTDIVKAVEEVEEKIFPNTSIRSHTFLLVLYCVLREIFPDTTAFTLIHVTGESTEVGIVENGTLTESISVPHGLNTIIRALMTKGDQNAKGIHSELTLYHEHGLTESREKEIEARVIEYTSALSEGLTEHTSTRRFPKQAFVLAPLSYTEFFKDLLAPIIEKELDIPGDILTLSPDTLGTEENEIDDMNMMIVGHFFHKLHRSDEVESA
jgi:hypothetical protein